LSVYLDASVLVALFVDDVFSARADSLLRQSPTRVVVSDFAAAEFASSVSRKVRMGRLSEPDAREAFATFDIWAARAAERTGVVASDVGAATRFLRRLDLTLRTADAINIAIAQRLEAKLASFDQKMIESATLLGVPAALP
jgi:uncharacterized protein